MAETKNDEDFDFEVDEEDLPDKPVAEKKLGPPSLIVDDLHVTYRVFGGRATPAGTGADSPSLIQRIRRRTEGHMGRPSEVRAVRGVSFVAHQGESIGIVGTNGSGKSTLLRAAAGLIPPAKGAVYVSSEPSLLGVNAVLMRQLSGERNIMIGGLALGLSVDEVRARFQEVVDFAELGEFVSMPMKAYSSGMAARLRFAISSVARPDILMIDEALATGDANFRQKSKDRIEDIRQHAGTIFLVSHSLETVKRMCSRVLWLDKGQLLMDGDPEEVTEAYREHVRGLRAARQEKQAAKGAGKGKQGGGEPEAAAGAGAGQPGAVEADGQPGAAEGAVAGQPGAAEADGQPGAAQADSQPEAFASHADRQPGSVEADGHPPADNQK